MTIDGTLIVGSITISATKTTLNTGETTTVTVTPVPNYAGYTLTSSKPTVATVAQDGTVTYVRPGTTTITATANDDNTKTASVVITCKALTEVVVDNNATDMGHTFPYNVYYYHSTTQQIHTPTEMGNKEGSINAIAFKVASSGYTLATSFVKIYMGYKTTSTFSSSSDYVPSNQLTLVYDGSPTLGTVSGWERLDLDTPFDYNGTGNLVVVVCKSSTDCIQDLKYYKTNVSNCALYRRNDNSSSYANIDSDNDYIISDTKASVKFWIELPPSDFEIEEGVAYTKTTNAENVNVTYTRSFDTDRVGKYQAWFLPFNYTITADDLNNFDFFKINMIANAEQSGENPASDDVYIFLNPITTAGTTLYGNKPYVYRPKAAVDDYAFVAEGTTLLAKTDASVLQTSTTTATYDFYGTYSDTEATTANPFYYVSKNGNICKGTTVTVGPYRWILKATAKNGGNYAPKFSFMEGETTGIHSIENGQLTMDNGVYNLNGQRVSQPTKGLYIVNGRKVVIK